MNDPIRKAYIGMFRSPYQTLETFCCKHSINPEESGEAVSEAFKTMSELDPELHDHHQADHLHDVHAIKADEDAMNHAKEYSGLSVFFNTDLHNNHRDPDRGIWGTSENKRRATIKSLDKTLSNHIADREFHVFTGIQHAPVEEGATEPVMKHLPAFTSTSSKFNVAKDFGFATHSNRGDIPDGAVHVLKIKVKPGTQIASLKHISEYPHEHEFLMNHGYDIKVHHEPTEIEEMSHPTYLWHAEVVGRNPTPLNNKIKEI